MIIIMKLIYYKNAFIFLVTKQNNKYKLMLVRPTSSSNKSFGIPGGMRDKNELSLQTMQREFMEETTNYITKEELILYNFKIFFYKPYKTVIYYGIIPNKKLRNGSINNSHMNEIDYIYHLDINKIFKYINNQLEFDSYYTIKSTSGKSYPLRRAMIESMKDMIKDKKFKQFIINLLV